MNDTPRSAGIWRHVPAMAYILLVATVLGLAVNGQLVRRAFHGESMPRADAPLTATIDAADQLPLPVDLAEIQPLAAAGAVVVDARHAADYAAGHLPGAQSLPLGELDARLADFRQRVPADTVIIVYCGGYNCHDSFTLGQRLLAAGYQDVRVFEGGFPLWRDSGLPVEKGAP